MKKPLFSAAAAVIALASTASAATVVIDFGQNPQSTSYTKNSLGTTGGGGAVISASNLLDTTGATTTIDISSGSTLLASAGNGGTFSPAGTSSYTTGSSTLVDGWDTTHGDIWQNLINAQSGGQAATLTFSGLAANTTYTFTLLSYRANTYNSINGTYQMVYGGNNSAVTTTLTGAGSLDNSTDTVTGNGGGGSTGQNAREIKWTFTTGASPTDATLNLNGGWNVNAIMIVPEPSAALLGGLGMLALLRRRRA